MNTCGLQSHEVGQLVYDDLPFCTSFVYSFDAPPLPVGPVNIVAQQGEPEYVRDFVFHQHSPPSAVSIHDLQFKAEKRIRSVLNPVNVCKIKTPAEKTHHKIQSESMRTFSNSHLKFMFASF